MIINLESLFISLPGANSENSKLFFRDKRFPSQTPWLSTWPALTNQEWCMSCCREAAVSTNWPSWTRWTLTRYSSMRTLKPRPREWRRFPSTKIHLTGWTPQLLVSKSAHSMWSPSAVTLMMSRVTLLCFKVTYFAYRRYGCILVKRREGSISWTASMVTLPVWGQVKVLLCLSRTRLPPTATTPSVNHSFNWAEFPFQIWM